jgi:hypothetical protein
MRISQGPCGPGWILQTVAGFSLSPGPPHLSVPCLQERSCLNSRSLGPLIPHPAVAGPIDAATKSVPSASLWPPHCPVPMASPAQLDQLSLTLTSWGLLLPSPLPQPSSWGGSQSGGAHSPAPITPPRSPRIAGPSLLLLRAVSYTVTSSPRPWHSFPRLGTFPRSPIDPQVEFGRHLGLTQATSSPLPSPEPPHHRPSGSSPRVDTVSLAHRVFTCVSHTGTQHRPSSPIYGAQACTVSCTLPT